MSSKWWETVAMRSAPMPEILSLVAVPIGNPKDLSLRAIETLAAANLIFCEDSRKTSDLFKRAGVSVTAKLVAVPGDSEFEIEWGRYCSAENRRWAVVSDAGTPIVNDPGVSLLAYCRKQGVAVEALPGASAPIMAWQWSGGFGLPFIFGGFAPKVSQNANTKWERFLPTEPKHGTFCFFDTRHQILDTLKYLQQAHPTTKIFIAREMTKPHEELLHGSVDYLMKTMTHLIEIDKVGELCVLIDMESLREDIHGDALTSSGVGLSPEDLLKFRSASTKEASKLMAKWCQLNSRDAYKRLCDET